jgi:tRNA threonylcarbamoyladenosine modification (KEOPS) complex  Pcc1 subunit
MTSVAQVSCFTGATHLPVQDQRGSAAMSSLPSALVLAVDAADLAYVRCASSGFLSLSHDGQGCNFEISAVLY